MKVDPSAIDSPLALIALFVAIIELFLIFPITKLTGRDRTVLVIFVAAYPVFIAGSFFIFLWHRPVHLYTPQTLSADLQKALLPERLNIQLAPDRAAVTAIELKVTSLETQFRDISQRMQSNTAAVSTPDFAKKSDLEAVKTEVLARAQATGDVSPSGLASVAREIQAEEMKSQTVRIAQAENQLSKFKLWIEQRGAKILPRVPDVRTGGTDDCPCPLLDVVTLGEPKLDYLAPGIYLHQIAETQKFDRSFATGTAQLLWTATDYMASRFLETAFPNPDGLYGRAIAKLKTGASPATRFDIYKLTYDMFVELSQKFGDRAVESGIVSMSNEWNAQSDLQSCHASIVKGMVLAGVDEQQASAAVAKFRTRIASVQTSSN